MNASAIGTALLAALLTSATAQAASSEGGQDARLTQQQQKEDAGAHGYQNPAGQDPDPRMSEHPNSESEITQEDETIDSEDDSRD